MVAVVFDWVYARGLERMLEGRVAFCDIAAVELARIGGDSVGDAILTGPSDRVSFVDLYILWRVGEILDGNGGFAMVRSSPLGT